MGCVGWDSIPGAGVGRLRGCGVVVLCCEGGWGGIYLRGMGEMYSFGSAILFGGFIVEDEVIVWKAIHAATVGWGMSVVVGLRGMWTARFLRCFWMYEVSPRPRP